MKELIKWGVCEKNFIRRVEPDSERVESIRSMAIKRHEKAKKENSEISFIVEGYYEAIKELLVAYLLKNGLRSANHQCLISYLHKMHPEMENEIDLISQMSFFRNRLDYYGEQVPERFYNDKKEDFDNVFEILLRLIDE